MNMPLLSICIPTYNRAEYLGAALDSVLNQLSLGQCASIEICVSDNASTDDTDEVVRSKSDLGVCSIVYSKNTSNLGFDLNVKNVVGMASGQYCWILGSDDVLAPGSIDCFLSKLKASVSPSDIYIFPRRSFFSDNLYGDLTQWLTPKGVLKLNYDFSVRGEFEEYLAAACSLGAGFSYISSMIFSRQCWLDIYIPESVIGSFYVHAFVLAKICHRGGTLEYLDGSYIFCRLGNDSFASEGRIKRVLVDYRAYQLFSDILELTGDRRQRYLSLLKLEHSYFKIFKHMCHPATFRERKQFGQVLVEFGYSYPVVSVFSVVTTLFFSKLALVVVKLSKLSSVVKS